MAQELARKLRENGFDSNDGQVLMLGEEVGEFTGAYRRWTGRARRSDTFQHVSEELADVIIGGYVVAEYLGIDLDGEIEKKRQVIFGRGWREGQTVTPTE
jgi:NTP pyrophosphatase (non-canonical NTP hydrolase)